MTESQLIQAVIVVGAIAAFLVVAIIHGIFRNYRWTLITLSSAYLILAGGFAWHTWEMRDLHNLQEVRLDSHDNIIAALVEKCQ